MKLYLIEMGTLKWKDGVHSPSGNFRPIGYATSVAACKKIGAKLLKAATFPAAGYRIMECAVPDRLTAAQWCSILSTDCLAADLEESVVLSDFVVAVDEVHRHIPRKKETKSNE